MNQVKDEYIKNTDDAIKEINYFQNNKLRMEYAFYKDNGYPIGSGFVEGSCKLVIKKRLKGNGMRWK